MKRYCRVAKSKDGKKSLSRKSKDGKQSSDPKRSEQGKSIFELQHEKVESRNDGKNRFAKAKGNREQDFA